jgi:CHAT domain-containing protein
LARAQYWLRTVTNSALQQWYATDLPAFTREEQREAGSETPDFDLWSKTFELIGSGKSVARYVWSNRYDADQAKNMIHLAAGQQDDPHACPFEDPIYWAGFQIIGW